ncbi:hypothetical protein LRS13_11150 [Svornostia abyssi]|uniref:Type II secretion system protein GspE N-terminal domain-containing protein n=1 Tax=Svornostia abyssi TaxID=2898438 RepID=A0ABY5PND5_9ACTN|nr:hypothetical protein LRS13_11150 [Parviterribacteraceae bacterium J379]
MTPPPLAERHDPEVARLLGEQVSRALGMVAYAQADDTLLVATANPDDTLADRVARAISGRDVQLIAAADDEIAAVLDEVFGAGRRVIRRA